MGGNARSHSLPDFDNTAKGMDEKYMQKLMEEQKRTRRVEFINLVACIVLAAAMLVSAGCDQLEYWSQRHQPQVQEEVVLKLSPEDAPKSLTELRQLYRKLLKIKAEKMQKNLDPSA